MANIISEALNRLFRTGDFLMEKHEQGKRTLLHKELGEIVFTKVKYSRSLRISLRPGKPVSVTMPTYVSYAEADKLVLEKLDWIKEEQVKLKETQAQRRTFTEEEIARLRAQAKQFLPARVAFLAQKFGFGYNKITVKDIHSRWGSCSSLNNLNFSIYLMDLPDDLVDYVILHELCHTVHRNHGVHFWELLDACTGGKARQLSARMDEHSKRMF
ncbi:MAG: M48 family metallopeptidase [Prevotellaceae bacterium]|jgi:predicted metal-dependent hydrolase|nr:M48 family metallopeptidase [Prevotellaceae bacterium]